MIENASIPQQDAAHVIDVDFNREEVNARAKKQAPLYGDEDFKACAHSLDNRSMGYRIVKRLYDIVFSIIVIVTTCIPLRVLSIFIAIDIKAFPVYSQERVEQVIIRHNFGSCLLKRLNARFYYLIGLTGTKSKCAFGERAANGILAVSA